VIRCDGKGNPYRVIDQWGFWCLRRRFSI